MTSPIDHGHLRGFMQTPEQNCICGAYGTLTPQYQCTRQWSTHQSCKNDNRDDSDNHNGRHNTLSNNIDSNLDLNNSDLNNQLSHQYRAPLEAHLEAHTNHRTINDHDTGNMLRPPKEEPAVEQREPQVSRSDYNDSRVPMARHTYQPKNTYHQKEKVWARGDRTISTQNHTELPEYTTEHTQLLRYATELTQLPPQCTTEHLTKSQHVTTEWSNEDTTTHTSHQQPASAIGFSRNNHRIDTRGSEQSKPQCAHNAMKIPRTIHFPDKVQRPHILHTDRMKSNKPRPTLATTLEALGELSDEEFDPSQAENQLIDCNTKQSPAQRQKQKIQTQSQTQKPLYITTAKTVILGKLLDTLLQDANKENTQLIEKAKNDKGKNRHKILWGAFATASKGTELAKGVRNKEGVPVVTSVIYTNDKYALIFKDEKITPTIQDTTAWKPEGERKQNRKPPPTQPNNTPTKLKVDDMEQEDQTTNPKPVGQEDDCFGSVYV